jgi:DNA-binding LacI/PurR family transcriptional regulator
VPFVAFGRTWRGRERGAWVDVDGATGVEQAVDHLHELGHRRIAFIGWPRGSGVGDDRYAGYVAACKRLGLSRSVVRGASGLEEDRVLAGQLLDRRTPPTALVCVSDLTAFGALRALQERGLRAGPDVAVVGFDDTPAAALPGIELSSVNQPIEEVGRAVVHLLLDALGVRDVPPVGAHRRLLTPTLTIRGSSRPLPSPEGPP